MPAPSSPPDISSFLGTDPGAAAPAGNPLTEPDYPEPADGEEADPMLDTDDAEAPGGDVDPEFASLAAELFPDWPEEDFAKFQQLIDLRLNVAPPAAAPGADPLGAM